LIGRVTAIAGSQATAELNLRAASGDHPTVGKFMGLMTGGSLTVGMISEVREQSAASNGHASHKCAQLDLIGEVRAGSNGTARFQNCPQTCGRTAMPPATLARTPATISAAS
jgi:hypothetical protein